MALKGIVVARAAGPHASAGARDAPAASQIANRPIVCHVMDALQGAGVADVAIVGPAVALESLRRQRHASLHSARYISSGSRGDLVGILAAAHDFVEDSACVVHAAEGLTGQPLHTVQELGRRDLPDVAVFVHHGCDSEEQIGPEVQRLLGISDLRPGRGRLGLAGVSLFGPGALRQACPSAGPVSAGSFADAIDRIAAGGGRLHVGRVARWRRFAGDPRDLLEMNRMVLDDLAPDPELIDPGDNRIEGRVQIDPTARIESSMISGPVVIGAGARIANSYIGPYSSIGEDVELDGAEVEGSIIADGAVLRHVGGRIAGSTIGRRARISRDFALPRAVHMHVGEGAELVLN